MFLTIVHQNWCIQFCHTLLRLIVTFPLLLIRTVISLVLHLNPKLPEILFHKFQNIPDQLITIAVAVKLLLPLACCRTETSDFLLQNRPDTHFWKCHPLSLAPLAVICTQLFTDTPSSNIF